MPNEQNLKKFTSEYQPEHNGRPKGSKNRSTIARKWLEATSKGENYLTKQMEELSEEDWQILSLIKQGRRGNTQAIKMLFDLVYGPMDKNINHSGSLSLQQITGLEVK